MQNSTWNKSSRGARLAAYNMRAFLFVFAFPQQTRKTLFDGGASLSLSLARSGAANAPETK
jgi:hypothetical protein